MDIYNLDKVDSTIDGVIGPLLYGFNIIGVHRRPLVTFSFDFARERPTLLSSPGDEARTTARDRKCSGLLGT
jgi:hypothetical protein